MFCIKKSNLAKFIKRWKNAPEQMWVSAKSCQEILVQPSKTRLNLLETQNYMAQWVLTLLTVVNVSFCYVSLLVHCNLIIKV